MIFPAGSKYYELEQKEYNTICANTVPVASLVLLFFEARKFKLPLLFL